LRSDDSLFDLRGAFSRMSNVLERVRIIAEPSQVAGAREVLTDDALELVAELHERFDQRRLGLLEKRLERQQRFDSGELPDFRPDTRNVREADWTISPVPNDLQDRRVEITGPTNTKDADQRAQQRRARVHGRFRGCDIADVGRAGPGPGQPSQLLARAARLHRPGSGKHYSVGDEPAVLIVRPRGLHLPEDHVTVDGEPVAGAFFDFAIYFWHNARRALAAGPAPISTYPSSRAWKRPSFGATSSL
jgi:malate synthase